jgi:hypothetical protein
MVAEPAPAPEPEPQPVQSYDIDVPAAMGGAQPAATEAFAPSFNDEPEPTEVHAVPPVPATPAPPPPPAPEPQAPPPPPPVTAPPPPVAAPAPPVEPAPPPQPAQRAEVDRSAPFEAVLLVGAGQSEPPQTAPLPPAGGPAPAPAPGDPGGTPLVLGIYCKNDHFNDPRIPYCGVCGISMVQATHVAKPGPRPPLGVLVTDDGATFRLDAPYVVGREPERDQEVVAGRARPLRISDRDGVVSRVHARVDIDGWDIRIVDLGSANGTQLAEQGHTAWTRIPPQTPVPIRPGTRVLFGHRGLRYESHRNP